VSKWSGRMLSYNTFKLRTGYPPVDDDLERVNCNKAGEPGHFYCGWCLQCNLPRFKCGHPLISIKGEVYVRP